MKVLVINCGSSSLKYQLIDSESEKVLAKGLCERIGIDGSAITHQPEGGEKVKTEVEMPNHTVAVKLVIDKLTDKENWKEKVPDKVKEGSYQYLANIFMCNVGAGLALGLLEKMGITSKAARAIVMTAGIVLTGVIGGSKVANFVSEKVIEPLFHKKDKTHNHANPNNDKKLQKHLHI